MATAEEKAAQLIVDPDPLVRQNAIRKGLAKTDTEKQTALNDPSQFVRRAMIEVIDSMTSAQLVTALDDPEYQVVISTIETWYSDMLPTQVEDALDHINPLVRKCIGETAFDDLSDDQKSALVNDTDSRVSASITQLILA